MKKMILVSGASGALGKAYVEHYRRDAGVRCVALTRTPADIAGVETICADLLDTNATRAAIAKLPLNDVGEITLIHTVGAFKFEEEGIAEHDADGDGIDDEVYASNVTTFENVVVPLLERLRQEKLSVRLTVCGFGSASDKYGVKYWQSYTRAKNMLREKLRSLTEESGFDVRSIFVNVSTTDTGNENRLRPLADKTYWLSPQEIVERSVQAIEVSLQWSEIEIIKPMPGFTPEYYRDSERILKKWKGEMGKKPR